MPFQFRLQAVLNLRQQQRDLCQLSVANARETHDRCVERLNNLASHRQAVMEDLRRMNDEAQWTTDLVMHHQRHASQLGEAIKLATTAIAEALSQLRSCREQLLAADQAVRALEKLAERRFADYQITADTYQ